MREDMMYDGRNPYGSRGGYVMSSRGGRGRGRGRRGDRGMDYGYDMRRDYATIPPTNPQFPNVTTSGVDMRSGYDGHYMHNNRRGGYEPVEFMGYCSGYYGSPEDYPRGDYRGRDYGYGYDMRGRMDYGYRDYGDYGETLSHEELEHWCHKLKAELSEQEKQMFSKEMIMQRAKAMGKPMENFGEKELEATVLMIYTDFKTTIGQNPDMAIKLAFDWLNDKDVAVKGAEKLAVYYDCIVEGE